MPVVPGSSIYNAQATRYNYSPERALKMRDRRRLERRGRRQRLRDGWPSSTSSASLITYDRGTTNTRSEAVDILASQLGMVGFEVNPSVYSSREVYDRLNSGDFQLALVAYSSSDIPNLNFMVGKGGASSF